MVFGSNNFSDIQLTDWPQREKSDALTVTVANVERVAPDLLEISVVAPELRDHQLVGPDEFFGLLMPGPGKDYVPLTTTRVSNLRAQLAALPDAVRPDLRWYTVRSLDRAAGTLSFLLVTHGVSDASDTDIGPALRWALRVAPGDTCGIYPANGLWFRREPKPGTSQLLVADPTAAPSVAAILEFLEQFHPAELAAADVVFAATTNDEFEPGLVERRQSRVRSLALVTAQQDRLLEAVVSELRSHERPESVWCCGERDLAAGVRRFAVQEWGIDPKNVTFSAFWIRGQARG